MFKNGNIRRLVMKRLDPMIEEAQQKYDAGAAAIEEKAKEDAADLLRKVADIHERKDLNKDALADKLANELI